VGAAAAAAAAAILRRSLPDLHTTVRFRLFFPLPLFLAGGYVFVFISQLGQQRFRKMQRPAPTHPLSFESHLLSATCSCHSLFLCFISSLRTPFTFGTLASNMRQPPGGTAAGNARMYGRSLAMPPPHQHPHHQQHHQHPGAGDYGAAAMAAHQQAAMMGHHHQYGAGAGAGGAGGYNPYGAAAAAAAAESRADSILAAAMAANPQSYSFGAGGGGTYGHHHPQQLHQDEPGDYGGEDSAAAAGAPPGGGGAMSSLAQAASGMGYHGGGGGGGGSGGPSAFQQAFGLQAGSQGMGGRGGNNYLTAGMYDQMQQASQFDNLYSAGGMGGGLYGSSAGLSGAFPGGSLAAQQLGLRAAAMSGQGLSGLGMYGDVAAAAGYSAGALGAQQQMMGGYGDQQFASGFGGYHNPADAKGRARRRSSSISSSSSLSQFEQNRRALGPAGLASIQEGGKERRPAKASRGMELVKRREKKRRARTFPEKLMQAFVEGAQNEDAVAWLPDGKSFVVVDSDLFCKEILGVVFKECKYASFVRKLHRWGFVRLTSGTGTDCFHHPLFQKGRRDLASKIFCAAKDKETKLHSRYDKPPSLAGVEKFIRARAVAAKTSSAGSSSPSKPKEGKEEETNKASGPDPASADDSGDKKDEEAEKDKASEDKEGADKRSTAEPAVPAQEVC